MRIRPRTWLVLSLLLFGAAYWVWTYAEKTSATRHAPQVQPVAAQPAQPLAKTAQTPKAAPAKSYRVSNTRLTEKQLLRSNHAIILRNALIDTDRPLKLDIPAHLRAKGAPGSYIVQSEQALDQRFYDRLKKEGAEFVSYIPNNAALVRATPEQARAMAGDALFQAVLPYEPYYKLAPPLLAAAVAQEQPQSEALNVTAFPGQRAAALAALQALGARLMGEENGPFGTTLTVMAPPEQLVAVAQMPLAKEIEPYAPRRALNDLTRVTMGLAADSAPGTSNYLNLTGANVTVNLNDTGVDATHPDFQGAAGPGSLRLQGAANALADYSGHGTHVAGIIMGNGSQSGTVTNVVPGETSTNVSFRGQATNAALFVQSLGLIVGATMADAFQTGGSLVSDAALQAGASTNLGPTNLISNNSWGYQGVTGYDMHAASFDQATRDAQPGLPGEQPLLFVFAAGGGGDGGVYGENGLEGSIVSPATAKNVLAVGALDAARFITNEVTFDGQSTNAIFFNWTDNNDLVSWFSGCGNVGAGTEGMFGRFKPDVVAPGMFTISCRATNYVDPSNAVYITTYPFPNQLLLAGQTNLIPLSIPADTEELAIVITPNPQSPAPFPNLTIVGDSFNPPATVLSAGNVVVLTNQLTTGQWYFGVTTPAGQVQPVAFDLTFYLVETNDLGVAATNASGYFAVMSNLNSALKPYYVYQYGTSMSAGAVSGMLALLQEFLQTKMGVAQPSPALLKGLLLNGSRSVEQQYDFNTQARAANEQGWGLPNLSNSLPGSLTSGRPSLLLVDQSPANALATGQSQSWLIDTADTNAAQYALRVTLTWTDPPGDPAAGLALVNNLAVLVTDKSGTNLWLGNDFLGGDIFSEANTGDLPDAINNVQNVYINGGATPFQFPLTVTVLGLRVNVNAASTVSNLIAQDYALVVSSDDTGLSNALTIATNAPTFAPPSNLTVLAGPNQTNASGAPLLTAPLLAFAQGNHALVTIASNGAPLWHQRAGANEPNLYANGPLYTGPADTNGNLFQWHFFVFTNDQWSATNFASNVAFTTFMPPDLATQISPRTNGADLDMYVSTDASLTNLNASAVANSVLGGLASLSRGGTETVILANSPANAVYYIGIKSEDQQAADFGFYGVAQQQPFSSQNPDGSVTAQGTGLPVVINDSDAGPPALVFAFLYPTSPMQLRNATVSVGLEHGNPSDLYGTLQHDQTQVVLNNYSGPPGGFTNSYNDLHDNTGGVDSDGPGTLKSYISGSGMGMWMLTEQDNALLQAGQVDSFSVTGFPQPLQLNFQVTIGANQWYDDYVAVPTDATNMTISVSYVSGGGPVGIYVTNVNDVGFNSYGVTPINPAGGSLNYGMTNLPPLAGGTWYYGIYNQDPLNPVTLNVQITFGLSLVPNLVQTYTNATWTPLTTDGTTNSSQICISNGQQILDVSVGLRLADTNLDDLEIQLTSPQGGSIILFENRGGLLATNLGLTLTNGAGSNYVYTIFTEDTNLAQAPVKFAPPPYASPIITPQIILYTNGFEGLSTSTYTNGQSVAGWQVATNEVSVMTDPTVARAGSNYLALANGRITQTFTTVPGAAYELRYYARSPGLISWWPADGNANDLLGLNNGTLMNGTSYAAGEVGRAFSFNGVTQYDEVADSPSLRPLSVTLECWINANNAAVNASLISKPVGAGWYDSWTIWFLNGDLNGVICNSGNIGPVVSYAMTPIPGVWYHTAYTFNNDTQTQTLYLNGVVVAAGPANLQIGYDTHPVLMGAEFDNGGLTLPFNGQIDETSIYNRALTAAEIASIHAAGNLGKYSTNSLYPNYQVAIDGIATNLIIITNFAGGWQAYTNSFIATNTQTTIELAGNTLGVLFDDVQLVQLAHTNFNNYYLPEEPMTPLIGQNPQGCWTLSIWDTRMDSARPTNGALLGWTLQLTSSSTNVNLIVLTDQTNNTYSASNLTANSIIWFGVDVPATAHYATNILTGSGPMNLFFNQNALPTGALPGDVTLITLPAGGGGPSNSTLGVQGAPPPLLPGQRYFLGLQNTGTSSESFTLQVNFDVSVNANILALTNGVPMTTSIGGNGPVFYSFTVPSKAAMATFQLLNPTGQVDLYAREGLPLPGPLSFDYQSLNAGTSDQFIVVTTNSQPVPLPRTPSTWNLSVYNFAGVSKLGYTILATYVTNGPNNSVGAMDIIQLTNGITYTNSPGAPPGFPTNLLYSFPVANSTAQAIQFTVTNITGAGNLQLLVGDGVFPTPENFYIGSFGAGTMNQSVTIVTNASLASLNNIWYAAVPNTSTNNVQYSITATIVTIGSGTSLPLFLGASVSSPAKGITLYWNAVAGTTYQVQVSANLINWSAVTNLTAQSTTASYTDAVPVSSQKTRYFRLVTP